MAPSLQIYREIKYLAKEHTTREWRPIFNPDSLTPEPVLLMLMAGGCSDSLRFALTSDLVDSFLPIGPVEGRRYYECEDSFLLPVSPSLDQRE